MIRKTLNKINRPSTPAYADSRLVLSLFVSVILHVGILMRYGGFSSPDTRGFQVPLTVKIQGGHVSTSTANEVVIERSSLRSEVSVETGASELASIAVSNSDSIAESQVKAPKPVDAPKRVAKKSGEAKPREEERTDALPQVPSPAITRDVPRQENQSSGIPLPGVTLPVRKAEIEFSLYSGEESTLVGVVRHSFSSIQTDTGEYYTIDVLQSGNSSINGKSQGVHLNVGGRILGDELVARRYALKGEAALRFFSLREASAPVPPGTELRGSTADGLIDRQTLLYYFSRRPPSFEGGGIWLADQSRNGYYRYRVEGFEDFSMPGHGSVRTLKVMVFESDKGETIELWLALDLRYLPVRVRHKDRAGLITDQVATSLSVE